MVEPTALTGDRKRGKAGRVSQTSMIVFTALITLLTVGLLLYMELTAVPLRQYYRYITILPVAFVAYMYGLKPGLFYALFFSTIFLPRLYHEMSLNVLSAPSIQILAFILFINTFSYIIADIATSIRTHEALSSTVRDWGGLLDRTTALDDVIKFILKQSQGICEVETAVFLLRSPLDAQWEIYSQDGKTPLPASTGGRRDQLNLAEWLLSQDRPLLLNHLDKRDSFLVRDEAAPQANLCSLLAKPLRHQDGTLMGMLVLVNKRDSDFTKEDLQALEDLIAGGSRALEQAGLYARTDYALARRVRQLAAIQRTARELNATLDPRQILERTLECALEITDGEAGLISLEMKGFPPLLHTSGVRGDAAPDPNLVDQARELGHAAILNTSESSIPPLLPQANSRLIAPIKREKATMGLIVVESSSPKIFKEASRHVLTILADHAANALENARLFQEIQKEEQRVSLIIKSMADGLFTTDPSGKIITFNPAAERLTGWSAADAAGRDCCEVLGCNQNHGPDDCPLKNALEEGEPADYDRFVMRQRSGTKRVIAMSLTPLQSASGGSEGSVFLFRDITEEEEMDRLQRELIAAISHELRAPLANMSTITETLMAEGSEILCEPYTRYLGMLMSQTQRLATFSDKILDIYRLETGRMRVQLRPLPVSLLVETVVKHWQNSTTKCTLEMKLPEKSPWVWADEDGFQTILSNLIDNAIKYSPPGTKIEVRVENQQNGHITIGVKDEGPGISPEHQSRIFERFFRVDGRDAQTVYGHGLGLYIARNLIDAMNGQIWVESETGKGSYFAFSLPIHQMEVNS